MTRKGKAAVGNGRTHRTRSRFPVLQDQGQSEKALAKTLASLGLYASNTLGDGASRLSVSVRCSSNRLAIGNCLFRCVGVPSAQKTGPGKQASLPARSRISITGTHLGMLKSAPTYATTSKPTPPTSRTTSSTARTMTSPPTSPLTSSACGDSAPTAMTWSSPHFPR